MIDESKTPANKWIGRSAVIVASLALFFGVRGCMSGPSFEFVSADDRRPDPSQPFPDMNGAGCFLTRAGHEQPQLRVPAGAQPETVRRAVADYVSQLITTETQQLSSAANIQQHSAGATTAAVNAYTAAIASGASPQSANQAAMVTAAQFLHNQGVMGPLICPVALGFDNLGTPRAQ